MFRRWVIIVLVCACVAGCQTGGQRETTGDYRTDQASQLTEDDARRQTQAKKRPMERRERERQRVIDQPR